MNQQRLSLNLVIFFSLLLFAFASIGGTANAQSPDDDPQQELNCPPQPKYKVFLPLITYSVDIGGRVTDNGRPAAGIYLALYTMKSTPELVQIAQTDPQGIYFFRNVPKLSRRSSGYRVFFENGLNGNPDDSRYLSWWKGDLIPSLSGGWISGGNFDIVDVALSTPETGSTVVTPALFGWNPRSVAVDSYAFKLVTDEGDPLYSSGQLGYVDQTTLSSLPPEVLTETRYWWNVRVFGSGDGYGASYWMRSVSFGGDPKNSSAAPVGPSRNNGSPFE